MKRSGGEAGRPFMTSSIIEIEKYVATHKNDNEELSVVYAELGKRNSKRSEELKSLVIRLMDKNKLGKSGNIGPLFDYPPN